MLFDLQDFSFLKVFKEFQIKKESELYDKMLVKSDGKSVDFVLYNERAILIKNFPEVEEAEECLFTIDIDNLDGILARKRVDMKVSLIPGKLTQGSKSSNVLQTYSTDFPDYIRQVCKLDSSEYKQDIIIKDIEKVFLASSYTNKDAKLGLVSFIDNFMMASNKTTTIKFDSESFAEYPGFDLDVSLVSIVTSNLRKNSSVKVKKGEKKPPMPFTYTIIDERYVYFELEGVKIYFKSPSYMTISSLLKDYRFIPAMEEKKHIVLDIDTLQNALKSIKATVAKDDVVRLVFSMDILTLETSDGLNFEKIDILENNYYLENFKLLLNLSGLMKIIRDIDNLELSDKIRFYYSGDEKITPIIKIEDYSSAEYQFYRSRIRD